MTRKNENRRASDAAVQKETVLPGGSNSSQTNRLHQQTQAQSWRDVLPIHPAAEMFPLMSPDELRELGEDIKKNGQRIPVTVWKCPHGNIWLLDGRNRLDAMERVGVAPIVRREDDALEWCAHHEHLPNDVDPYAYVISSNIHRRHLTAKKKRELIEKLVAMTPEKSDRAIAETAKVSHNTVKAVRAEMQGRGQIDHVNTRTDSKGRKQPAAKKKAKATAAKDTNAAISEPPKRENNHVDPSVSAEAMKAKHAALDNEQAAPADHPITPVATGPSYGIEAVTWDGAIWRQGVRLATREEASFYLTFAVDDRNPGMDVVVSLREIRVYESKLPPTKHWVERKRDGSLKRCLGFMHGTCGDLGWGQLTEDDAEPVAAPVLDDDPGPMPDFLRRAAP